MAQTYADARAAAAAASQGPISYAPYSGSTTDLAYLKAWVLNEVTARYGVDASTFDQATVFSTSLLRDFVHRATEHTTPGHSADPDLLQHLMSDVGAAFRYQLTGLCPLPGFTQLQVFRAFGYDARNISSLNDPQQTYDGTHCTTEVFLADLGKWAVQDSYFNYAIRGADGGFLDWSQARAALHAGRQVDLDAFASYTYFYRDGAPVSELPPDLVALITDNLFEVLYSVHTEDLVPRFFLDGLFPNSMTAHTATSHQGGTFAAAATAGAEIARLAGLGLDWLQIAKLLRDGGYYVSGFADDGSHWVTVRLADGSYRSHDIDSGAVLTGALDELWNQGFEPTQVYVLGYDGAVMTGLVDSPDPTPLNRGESLVLRDAKTGAVKTWNMADGRSLDGAEHLSPASDRGYAIVDRGNYQDDAAGDILWHNAASGQVGIWDAQTAEWTSLGSMNRSWTVQSRGGHSDFRHDGYDDVLWRNSWTGEVGFWNVVDGENKGYSKLASMSLTWKILGTGDFNGDGTDDILWRNSRTGEVREWLLQDGQLLEDRAIWQVSPGWTVVGIGDFTGDGSLDVLWRERGGALDYWDMDGGTPSGQPRLGMLSSDWKVLACTDVTGEGVDDIVMRNGRTGEVRYWDMDGTPVLRSVGTLDGNWHLI